MTLIRNFLKTEAASGIILFIAALIAFCWSNSIWQKSYDLLFVEPIHFGVGAWNLSYPFSFWINDGLMSLFFLLIGFELKKEILEGELSSFSKVSLPAFAALGGMILPAVLYILLNWTQQHTLKGWPIPVATDIAFALGVLSLFGRRVPFELKLFLMALAIFDDLGSILIIAFYHNDLAYGYLIIALVVCAVLFFLLTFNFKNKFIYFFLSACVWVFIFKSKIHPSLAGVLVALFTPTHFAKRIQSSLASWVSFLILPLFALANAGLELTQINLGDLMGTLTLGIFVGLLFGKPIGVLLFSFFLIRVGYSNLPKNSNWYAFFGVAILCGIGFTMSLFLGNLAFRQDSLHYQNQVRMGVFMGSLSSGMLGAFVLSRALNARGRPS